MEAHGPGRRTAEVAGLLDSPPVLAPGPHATGPASAAVRLKQLRAAFVSRSQQVNMAHNSYKCLSKHNDVGAAALGPAARPPLAPARVGEQHPTQSPCQIFRCGFCINCIFVGMYASYCSSIVEAARDDADDKKSCTGAVGEGGQNLWAYMSRLEKRDGGAQLCVQCQIVLHQHSPSTSCWCICAAVQDVCADIDEFSREQSAGGQPHQHDHPVLGLHLHIPRIPGRG